MAGKSSCSLRTRLSDASCSLRRRTRFAQWMRASGLFGCKRSQSGNSLSRRFSCVRRASHIRDAGPKVRGKLANAGVKWQGH
jgi:hypothetical protein